MRFVGPQNRDPKIGQIITQWLDSIAPTVNETPMEEKYDSMTGYDVMEFIDDLYDFLNEYQTKTQSFQDFSFQPSFTYALPNPDEQNAFRYTLHMRTDASLEQGAGQHNGRKSQKWILYNVMEDKFNPGYKVLVYIKPFDNTIDFTSWSKNYTDANKAAFEFENLMSTYGYMFKMKGLQDLRFEGRQKDMFHERGNVAWYGCPLRYYVKTYKIKLVYEKMLEEIILDFTIKNN